MPNLKKVIESKDKQAREFARRLQPYLTDEMALQAFEYYGHMVRERAEAQTLLRVLRSMGYEEE